MELPPECAARFKLGRLLGTGGHGAVYAARQIDLDRPAAVKLLKVDAGQDGDLIRRFEAEAVITASLAHPNIVVVYDHGSGGGQPWIAYEMIEGRTLRDELEEGVLSPARAVKAAIAIAAALEHAHAHGVLHRDIKPDNVFALKNGGFKVADFGIAKWSREGGVTTKTGVILATPHYVAPEQVKGEPASASSDLYALGAVLFELLAGRPPYAGATLMETLEGHLRAPVPSLMKVRPDVPRALDAVCQRALAKTVAERPASAAALREELEACRPGLSDDSSLQGWKPPVTRKASVQLARTGRSTAASDAPTRGEISRRDTVRVDAPRRARWWWAVVPMAAIAVVSFAFKSMRPAAPVVSAAPVTSAAPVASAAPVISPSIEAYTPVYDLLVRPTATDVMVDFTLAEPASVRVVLTGDGRPIPTAPELTTWFHKRIGGLDPATKYRLDVIVGEAGRGVSGYRLKTRSLEQDVNATYQVEMLNRKASVVADVSLGVVEDCPHRDMAAALKSSLEASGTQHFFDFRHVANLARGERDRPLAERLLAQLERIPASDNTARSYAMEAAGMGHAAGIADQARRWISTPPAGTAGFGSWYSACALALVVNRAPDAGDLIAQARETGPSLSFWNEPRLPLWMIRVGRERARERFLGWLRSDSGHRAPGAGLRDLRAIGLAGMSYLDDARSGDALFSVARSGLPTEPQLWVRAVEALGGATAPGARGRVGSLLATHGTSPPIALLWAGTRQECPEVIPLLEHTLTDPSASSARRVQAAGCLEYLGGGGRAALLAALTRVKDPSERCALAFALLAQGAPEGRAVARELLEESPPDATAAAAFALARARDRESLPVLERRMSVLPSYGKAATFLHAVLLAAYAELGGPEAVPLLTRTANDEELDSVPRTQAKYLLLPSAGRSYHLVTPAACFQRTRLKLQAGQAVSVSAAGQWGVDPTTMHHPAELHFPHKHLGDFALHLDLRVGPRVLTCERERFEAVAPVDGELVFTPFGGEFETGLGPRVRDESERRGPMHGAVLVLIER